MKNGYHNKYQCNPEYQEGIFENLYSNKLENVDEIDKLWVHFLTKIEPRCYKTPT
jgi:hypothetical protein